MKCSNCKAEVDINAEFCPYCGNKIVKRVNENKYKIMILLLIFCFPIGILYYCLNYEDDQYTELKREFPSIGTIVKHKNVSGKVISHNLFKRTFDIESVDKTIVTIDLDEYEGSK